MSEVDKGLMLLSMFTPTQIAAICDAYNRYGSGVISAAQAKMQRYGNVPPMMAVVPIDLLDEDDVQSLVLGLRAELLSALYRQATRDDYAMVLTKLGVPSSLAYTEAERILTPDADMRGFVLNNLSWLPAFPFELGKNFVAGAAGILQSVLPEAWINRSNDRIYEILRLGQSVRELSKRSALSRMEVIAEAGNGALSPTPSAATLPNGGGGGATGNPAAQQTATTMAESLLGMLVGSTLGSALLQRFGLPGIIAGQLLGGYAGHGIGNAIGGGSAPQLPAGTTPANTPTPPALPPGGVGDWNSGVEYGDHAGGYDIPADIRAEAGAALIDFLDSAREFEQGGWGRVLKKGFKLLKPLAAKVAPIATTVAGGALGGPVGAMLGNKLGNVLGSGLDDHLTDGEKYAVATTAATTRSLAPRSQEALRRILAARGGSATIADLLAAIQ